MTMRPKKTAHRRTSLTAIPFLSASAVLVALAAAPSSAELMPQQIVYPRAGVSSDAYRSSSSRVVQRSLARQAQSRTARAEPRRLVHARAQNGGTGVQIVPIDHRTVTPVSARRDNRQEIRAELERLYTQNGQQMPQSGTQQYQPQPGAGPIISPNAGRPAAEKPASRGLLAGLFDFARKGKSRPRTYPSGVPTRPPAEPKPFRPPTYRQQLQAARSAQPQPMPRTQPPALQKQSTVQSSQSADVFTLRKGTQAPSPRNFAEPAEGFFPEDSQRLPTIASQGTFGGPSAAEDVEQFFPADAATAPPQAAPVDVADDNMKARMNDLLNSRSQVADVAKSSVDESEFPFQMPALSAEEEIEPPAVPAAVSEVVTTNVAPFEPSGNLNEPAPFFSGGERAIDPEENMDIAAMTGQTFDPSGADSEQTAGTVADAHDAGSRMQQIAAREGTGMKGFCPVALRDDRELQDGRAGIVAFYEAKAYYFSSPAAKDAFEAAPQKYAPAANGEDVTMKTLTGEVVEGSLDHCVWYKDRLYLFTSADNLATFMAAPSAMAVTN